MLEVNFAKQTSWLKKALLVTGIALFSHSISAENSDKEWQELWDKISLEKITPAELTKTLEEEGHKVFSEQTEMYDEKYNIFAIHFETPSEMTIRLFKDITSLRAEIMPNTGKCKISLQKVNLFNNSDVAYRWGIFAVEHSKTKELQLIATTPTYGLSMEAYLYMLEYKLQMAFAYLFPNIRERFCEE